jgi:hypothetical protein
MAAMAAGSLLRREDEPHLPTNDYAHWNMKWICFCEQFNFCSRMLYRNLDVEGFMRFCRKTVTVHELFIDFKEAHELVRKDILVLYNILMEFTTTMKVVKLIKMLFTIQLL